MPLTATHWGTYWVETGNGRPLRLQGIEGDPQLSGIGQSMLDTLSGPVRIGAPMVRRGFLEHGPGGAKAMRGRDAFVEMAWDDALDLAADELERVRATHGNPAIYAGSYGWASAGRFHHAQSQLRRFMNLFGGCTVSRNAYSYAAAEVILPHVVAPLAELLGSHTSWRAIAEAGSLVVAFGGMASRNGQVNSGGLGRHSQGDDQRRAHAAGAAVVNISPDRHDVADDLDADWISIRPGADVALMLALAHTLVNDGRHDVEFLNRYCVGFERFLPYLTGAADGVPKDAAWAAEISGVAAETITGLARRMASGPTLVNVSWSLTRQQNGEQIYWMAVVLAAMLGGIGRTGEGFGLGLGAVNGVGSDRAPAHWAALPAGRNPIDTFIPVARIADMLLHPGESFSYDGGTYTYPDVRLVYWAGGNPFHHHQDLNRLRRAWQRIETVIVHEPFWTPLARHADIVFPATVALERNDIAGSSKDDCLVAMHKASEPYRQSRNDHDIFAGLARRVRGPGGGNETLHDAFTGGRDEAAWLRVLYERTRVQAENAGVAMPPYDAFVEQGLFELPRPAAPVTMLQAFREDPDRQPLRTPSGRIEIFSETIAGFGIEGWAGHPVWIAPGEWHGSERTRTYPLHLLSHQPSRRLHSQLDHGAYSRAGKIGGREPCRVNPDDARRRGIADGDTVRLFNDRGGCLSVACLDPGVREGVVMIATGAWYDPDLDGDDTCCKHGNPNTLTDDLPTSELAQGPSALSCLVEIERYAGDPPPVTAFFPPEILPGNRPGHD